MTDRIQLELSGSEELHKAVSVFQERLTGENLGDGGPGGGTPKPSR